MKIPHRLLTLALATGAFTVAGVTLPSAFAQDDAVEVDVEADAMEEGDPMAGFTMPEPPPAHDYETGPDADGFATLSERVSYAIGVNIGTGLSREFEQMGAELDSDALSRAIGQAVAGEDTKLDEMQVGQTLQAFQQQMMEQQMAAAREAAAENAEEAEAFFAENAEVEGVVTTDSGLQYKLDTEGEGDTATEGQVVTLNYRGTLLDGTEFDSSYGGGQPAEFPVGAVIPGFNEALLLMPVGSKGTIWIPADLAYGDSPPGGSAIEPGSALIFELEILGVEAEPEMEGFPGMEGFDEAGAELNDATDAAGEAMDGAADAVDGAAEAAGDLLDDDLNAPGRDPVAD